MFDIDEVYYKAVDLLRGMISTPSVSRDESAVADLICRFLESEGCSPLRFNNNIYLPPVDFDPEKPTILLNSHIDTVKPVDGWTYDPFTPEYDLTTGRMYGLGSNDAGASAVSLVATWLLLRDTEQPYNLALLLSAEEEVSGKNGMESMVPQMPDVALAIVGEPTGMRPAIAEKGLMVLDAEVHGVSGHAARNEGVNAIYKAIEAIDKLRGLEFEKVSDTLGPVKISVTQISAGTQHNVVPDLCRFVVDVRTTDAYSNIETLEMMRSAVPEVSLTPRSTRLNPSGIPADHPFVVRAGILGLEPFGSPTLSDQALMPWPSVKIGPGDSARSHTADEYIEPEEIRGAIDTYLHLLRGLKV